MLGLMQQRPLLISSLLTHAARHHGDAEVVSATGEGGVRHATWGETERRARRLVRALQGLGVKHAPLLVQNDVPPFVKRHVG